MTTIGGRGSTRMVRDGAESGWVVEVMMMTDDRPDPRFFAVGIEHAADAEEAVLRFPGLLPQDRWIARRRLSPVELCGLELRVDAVQPLRLP